jgi:hypothetical protein
MTTHALLKRGGPVLGSIGAVESGEWKIVHRHADPISTEDDLGPLRTS